VDQAFKNSATIAFSPFFCLGFIEGQGPEKSKSKKSSNCNPKNFVCITFRGAMLWPAIQIGIVSATLRTGIAKPSASVLA